MQAPSLTPKEHPRNSDETPSPGHTVAGHAEEAQRARRRPAGLWAHTIHPELAQLAGDALLEARTRRGRQLGSPRPLPR